MKEGVKVKVVASITGHEFGIGEEKDDLWVSYFKNGKHQRVKAQITFESFDESKLK